MKKIIAVFTTLIFLSPFIVLGGQKGFKDVVKEIEFNFKEAITAYENGDQSEAQLLFADSYGELFEGKGMEAAIGSRWPNKKTDIERQFGSLYSLSKTKNNIEDLKIGVNKLISDLTVATSNLETDSSSTSWLTQGINSFLIILREGMEAILIIAALIAYLIKTGHEESKRLIIQATFVAIFASILTAIVFNKVLISSPESRENIEGITMLLASGVLFYVSYWLISKANATRWSKYIKSKADQSLSTGKLSALWFTAFLAVYREGAETVLFYQALVSSAPTETLSAIWTGFGIGLITLIAVYILMRITSVKLPLNIFFSVTGVFLFYLCFVFAGKGIIELQVGRLLQSTPINWLPDIAFLQIFGVYPTWESISLQIILVSLAFLAFLKIKKDQSLKTAEATI